jgi:hypothetical protein
MVAMVNGCFLLALAFARLRKHSHLILFFCIDFMKLRQWQSIGIIEILAKFTFELLFTINHSQ